MNTEFYEDSFEVDSPAHLVVKNVRGSVTVVPGEDGVIKVKAEKILDSGADDDLLLEVYQEGKDTVCAVARLPERLTLFGSFRPCKVHFTIEAPVETWLKIKTVSARVDAKGFTGDAYIKSVSGDQQLADLTGLLEFDSVSGEIEGRNLTGKTEISTVSGRIHITEGSFPALLAKTVSGRIEVETPLEEGPYTFSTVSGSTKLVVPEGSSCDVHASSVSGRFYTDLDVSRSDIGRRSWFVRIGQGDTHVKMKTVSGRMSLVSSWDAKGSQPGEKRISRAERESVLTKLSEGQLSVEEALKELS
jgi:hypothetical protein